MRRDSKRLHSLNATHSGVDPMRNRDVPRPTPLLADPRAERAACGTGLIAHLSGHASHELLCDALSTVSRLAHRGAISADARTGDGAGILTQIPFKLLARELASQGLTAPAEGDLAVGMFFLPRLDLAARAHAQDIVTSALRAQGVELVVWREVPVDPQALGQHGLNTRPHVEQALLGRSAKVGRGDAFERALYLARKEMERRAREACGQSQDGSMLYVPSLSARTIVYKGLLVAPQLAPFYADLCNPAFETAFALFHQRYSTNTFPTWERAQPFRMLCHNGEINTLQGNIAWMRAREPHLASTVWCDAGEGENGRPPLPVIDAEGSDSAMLDNVFELLTLSGREAPHALMMLVPEAWEGVSDIAPAWRAFYRYHSALMEPWDGPAAIAFTDGRIAGMTLDRNGLRPARYLVTSDGLVVAASEAGALEVDPARVVEKGKLGPGQMIVADVCRGKLWHNDDIKNKFSSRRPYRQWLDRQMQTLYDTEKAGPGEAEMVSVSPRPCVSASPVLSLTQLQAVFGYTDEELVVVLRPMAEDRAEAIGAMGDDTPHAVFSEFERPLYHYFKQRFAQVTNPPIDPLRERLVMSTRVLLGGRGNILEESSDHAHFLEIPGPLLTDERLQAVRERGSHFPFEALDTTFMVNASLESALDELCLRSERAVDSGKTILILSDRMVGARCAPIPMLLAVSSVHHHLLRTGKRWLASLIAETGEARDVHQFACLIGYGANAINPYVALATVKAMVAEGHIRSKGLTPERAEENFVHAAEKGLLKIISKMGIATLDAYHGAQIFEIVGLADDAVERYFPGTPSPVGGLGVNDLAVAVLAHHDLAFQPQDRLRLKSYGFFKFKKQGEYHAMNPDLVGLLQEAVRTPGALDGNFGVAYDKYKEFSASVHSRPPTDLSDHLEIIYGDPVPLEQVEPPTEIVKCFSAAAMSHGSLSLEAHQTIAEAMNRLGALSNSGEGGEHVSRYGTLANSPVKQVASARFGVTPAYLMSADELQIKIAQGSKPGEGGQLPAHKVSPEIATIRHAQPGIALISPPPHHDIYSIEDLAQLIYDLKRINPRASVSVKLVAEAGVGTIAAGVAKAHADIIQISGHSGGTGASPLSSIKHAGVAWELGLAETQQILVGSDLRGRVRLRVDGGFKTARQVIVAALLGADEFSFGTAALVASGCIMARACHLNTCPVGIATQREELRKKFPRVPEWVMAYFLFVAAETREYLAAMGCRSLAEITGEVSRLRFVERTRPHRAAAVTIPLTLPAMAAIAQ
jgi:glutamate synthase (ferredoxin)